MSLITITQTLGSVDPGTARQVAETLGVEFFDDNRLKKKAEELGVHSEDLKKLDEKTPGFLDRFFSTKPAAFLDYMESVVYEVARNGEGVIVDHGGPILLRNFDCALHVYIHASLNTRIVNLMEQHDLDTKTAEDLVRKNDNNKRNFFRYAFNLDWNDPSLYDLYINTDKLGSASTVKLITTAAKSDEAKACSLAALDAMNQMSLEKKLRGRILEENIDLTMLSLPFPEKNVVNVSGFTYSERDKNRLMEILNADSDVSEVRSQIALMQHIGE
jgi:cytidylate kinase